MKQRMIYKKVLSGILLAGIMVSVSGQGLTSAGHPGIITRLNIGDKVPNIVIKNVINAKTPTVSLSAYKGKLLLLDFWETSCSNCIKALPKIEKLQKQFTDKMEVITVTRYGTKEEVTGALQRFKILKDFSLPTVIGDDKLYKYFPFKLISHVVWIGEDGIVKAITGTEHITEDNIKQVLEGNQLNWPVKNDLMDFDYNKPLLDFTNSTLSRPNAVYSSTFTRVIEGIDATTVMNKDTITNTLTVTRFNGPLLEYCRAAVSGKLGGDISLKDVVLEVKDPSRFSFKVNSNGTYWTGKGTSKDLYCYSISLPADLSDDTIMSFIREDISRWLKLTTGITVKKEDRTVACLKLVRTKKDDRLLGADATEETMDFVGDKKVFRNTPARNLVEYLNSDLFEFPFVVNETGLPADKTIDIIELTAGSNLEELRQALSKYGLGLEEGTISRSMYVITEADYKKQ